MTHNTIITLIVSAPRSFFFQTSANDALSLKIEHFPNDYKQFLWRFTTVIPVITVIIITLNSSLVKHSESPVNHQVINFIHFCSSSVNLLLR